MRLINTSTLELQDFTSSEIPPYAILSHTWGAGEVTFRDMSLFDCSLKKGYVKIKGTCGLALKRGIGFAWVDTCCIDKSSSAELTESINSMFQWYRDAVECYVFLEDLPPDTRAEDRLSDCRWFTRGWTLQELIAPEKVRFYDRIWQYRGSKRTLLDIISSSTNIPGKLLSGKIGLHSYSIAQRMSWAARRQTTRVEDVSYCLLGIFDVNMPLIYGEGMKAFRRLQEEIIKRSNDLTLFAWDIPHGERHEFLNLFAESPKAFIGRSDTKQFADELPDFSVTNKGLLISNDLPVREMAVNKDVNNKDLRYVSLLGHSQSLFIGICLRKVAPRLFHRDGKFSLIELQADEVGLIIDVSTYYILIDSKPISTLSFKRFRKGALHVPLDDLFRLRAEIPRTLWDVTDRVFLRPNFDDRMPYPMVVAMEFEGTIAGKLVRLAVICNYTSMNPDFKIFSADQYPRHMSKLNHNDLKNANTHWEEFKFEAPEILKLNNYTDIKIGDQLFRITVLSKEGIVRHVSMNFELVSVRLDVEQIVGKKFLPWRPLRRKDPLENAADFP